MKTGSNCKLHGVIPAIVTPLRPNGDVDEALLRKQTEYLVSSGVNGLFVCGGTGEGAYLTTAEKKRVFEVIQETAAGRVFLCLAVINSNTRATLAELEALSTCKPDFFVSTPPYYHAMTQQDILSHYAAVTAASTAPVILYNIPSTTHNIIELDTVYALSKLPNVAGIKDSSGNFVPFSRGLFGPRSDQFAWIQGEDYLCGSALLCGGDGMVSGLSNTRVEPYVEMYRAYEQGDTDKIIECQRRINFLYRVIHSCGNGNAAIKAVTELAGRGARYMRQGSMNLTDEQVAVIAQIMAEYEAL